MIAGLVNNLQEERGNEASHTKDRGNSSRRGSGAYLTACGGGGDEETPDPVVLLSESKAFARLTKTVERSDAFTIPALHFDYSLVIGDSDAIEERMSNDVACMGTSCDVTAESGAMQSTAVQDLIDLTASIDQAKVSLGSRDGFDTIAIVSEFDVSNIILDEAFTATPPIATAFGAWGGAPPASTSGVVP